MISLQRTKAGGLFKCGIIIANCRAVTLATQKIKEMDAKAKEEVVKRKKARDDSDLSRAREAYSRWSEKMTVDADGYPKLCRKDAFAIVKVLLLRLNTDKKVLISSFKNGRECVKWLGDIRRGTTWHGELKALFSELDDDAYGAPEGDDEVEGTQGGHKDDKWVEGVAD
jgi:hypothetical protein